MKNWFFLFLFFLLLPFSANAFFLAPAKIELTIDSGGTQIVEIKIKNYGATTSNFRPVIMGVEQTVAGSPSFVSGNSEVESWATAKMDSFVLAPKQEKNIRFIINVPAGAYPGSYYLGLGAEESGGQSGNVNLASRLLSLVNIKVAGMASEELQVKHWEGQRGLWFKSSWDFSLQLQNIGNVELPLSGKLLVRDFWGRELVQDDIFLGNKLLPNSERNLVLGLKLPEGQRFIPGIYQVDLLLNYGLTRQQIVTPTKVWYIYPPTAFLILVIISSPIIFWLGKKIFLRKK